MSSIESSEGPEQKFSPAPDKISAGASKRVAACIGEVVTILSRSSAHKHYSIADLEWLVLPAVASGQFYIVEAAHKRLSLRAPVAFVSWAYVSDKVDQRLSNSSGPRVRLCADEWKCGDTAWLIDAIGPRLGVLAALQWLKSGFFKEGDLKLRIGGDGGGKIDSLANLRLPAMPERESHAACEAAPQPRRSLQEFERNSQRAMPRRNELVT